MGLFVLIIAIIVIVFVVKGISKRNKEKASEYYRSAAEHERNGNYDQAINDYNQGIQIESDPDYRRYKERGDLYRKIGNYDQAIADYNQAIRSTESYMENRNKIWYEGKAAAIRQGKLGQEGWEYDNPPDFYTDKSNIAEYKRKIAESLSLRGEMYDKKGDKDLAMADYDEAIKFYKNSGTEGDLISCADVYIKKGNKEQAIEIYNKFIWEYNKAFKKDPKNFLKLYSLCQMCVKAGDYDQAIANFETLLQFNQDNVKNYEDVKVLKDTQTKAREELDAIKKIVASK